MNHRPEHQQQAILRFYRRAITNEEKILDEMNIVANSKYAGFITSKRVMDIQILGYFTAIETKRRQLELLWLEPAAAGLMPAFYSEQINETEKLLDGLYKTKINQFRVFNEEYEGLVVSIEQQREPLEAMQCILRRLQGFV